MSPSLRGSLACCWFALAVLALPAAAACDGSMQLQVLGSGGPELVDGRASTSYLVWVQGKGRILVDTGSGTMAHYAASGARVEDLQAVLFTHFHVDHSADFPALIKRLSFTDYDGDLAVYGPAGNRIFPGVKQFAAGLFNGKRGIYAYLGGYADPAQPSQFKLTPHEVAPKGTQIVSHEISPGLTVHAIAAQHGPVPALSWSVEAGGCKLTFSGDTGNSGHTLELLAQDSDLLVAHNAAADNEQDRVARLLHMVPEEIGRVAEAAHVRQLVLSHRMRRTLGKEAETTAAVRRNYAGPLQFAEDNQVISLVK